MSISFQFGKRTWFFGINTFSTSRDCNEKVFVGYSVNGMIRYGIRLSTSHGLSYEEWWKGNSTEASANRFDQHGSRIARSIAS